MSANKLKCHKAEREIKMNKTTLKIHEATTIQSIGKHRIKNAKPVYVVEESNTYNSVRDAAIALGVCPSVVSDACNKKIKTAGKKHVVFVDEIMENFDMIASYNRGKLQHLAEMETKAKAYDAIITEQQAKAKKQERLNILVSKTAQRKDRIKRDTEAIMKMEMEIQSLQEELM